MELTLVENALDFFLEAIRNLSARRYKYAVLHAAGAAELLLKARLFDEHWALIFANPGAASRAALEGAVWFRSVGSDEALERLNKISGIDVGNHEEILKKLRDLRNQIQHFEFSTKRVEASSIVVKTCSFLMDFLHDHLKGAIQKHKRQVDAIRRRITKHEGIVEQRRTQIEARLAEAQKSGKVLLDCPVCLQEGSLEIPGGDAPQCHMCRYQDSGEVVAERWADAFYYSSDPKERWMQTAFQQCDSCGAETLHHFQDEGGMLPPDPAWVCFTCGESGPFMMECKSCGGGFPWQGEDVELCEECEHKNR